MTQLIENIIKPMRPISRSEWVLVRIDHHLGFQQEWYLHPEGYVACSAMEVTDGIVRNESIPQYHISISKTSSNNQPIRCDSNEAKAILKQFNLSDALEDNHTSGVSRSFWQPVDENQIGRECSCTDEQAPIVEDKGDYVWRPAH